MQAVRFYHTLNHRELHLQVPIEFANSQVEVIVLLRPMPQKTAIRRFRGALKTRRTRTEIDQFIENLRSEWERSI